MKLITRSEWGARPARSIWRKKLTGRSTGHWNGPKVTVAGKTSWDHSKCFSLVRGIQNFHMDGRKWNDIAYNYVICPHGHVFEGRGMNVVNGANGTNHGNQTSHALMWLSGQGNPFTSGEKTGFSDIAQAIAKGNQITPFCVGHRDHKSTECPGNERYSWIRNGMKTSGGSPPSSGANSGQTIKRGQRGKSVEFLQALLIILKKYRVKKNGKSPGSNLIKDGVFGPATEEAVKEFQRFMVSMWILSGKKGRKPEIDGVAGPQTLSAISFWTPIALKK